MEQCPCGRKLYVPLGRDQQGNLLVFCMCGHSFTLLNTRWSASRQGGILKIKVYG